MKSLHLVVVAFAAMGSAMSAQTHEGDPGGTIEGACTGESMRMAATTTVVEQGNWAAQTWRVRTLSLARQACANGATVVTPPAEQRWCQTATTWSTSCLDGTATTQAADTSVSAGRRRTNAPDVTPTVEIAL